jgi:PEP-CTERM motif
MRTRTRLSLVGPLLNLALAATSMLVAGVCCGDPFFFSTGSPDGRMATASRPDSAGKVEIESADDFVLTGSLTTLTSATFTGLVTGASPNIGQIVVEIYRVFPKDSTVPPSGNVPTRVNSPSDVEFADRDTAAGNLSFTTTILSSSFTAANSVLNGINKVPNQTTGGEGAVSGEEVQFNIIFTVPIDLAADHYFFVPQVQVTGGEFYWLSAPRPIVAPGTAFPAGFTDLQSWVRNQALDPDWLRVGTDIVGGTTPPTFNAAFSLTGRVPEPGTLLLLGVGMLVLWGRGKRGD